MQRNDENRMSQLDDLRDTLAHARVSYEAWWLFTGPHQEREGIVRVFNSYLRFFRVVHPALWVTFVVKLASVFGTRSEEISLRTIPGAEQDCSFAGLWQRDRRLHRYRSKVIAHRDKELLSRNYARESGFTYDALKALLDDTCAFFDSAAVRLSVGPVDAFSCEADLLRLVQRLGRQERLSSEPLDGSNTEPR